MSRIIERLQKRKDDRGMMANLRCVLVENKKHRAWPVLNRLGIEINDEVAAFIAGLYATHPETTTSGNFGATCKKIERERDGGIGGDSRLTPTERRFQLLLTAEKGAELHGRVLRMVLMAKSQGVPVNYAQLETDLKFWGDRTKTGWATSFWAQSAPLPEEAV
jgi:CRISPR system Cascade subunit CasB